MEVNIYYFFIFLNVLGHIFCSNKDVDDLTRKNNHRPVQRIKRIIEYTRWRMATRSSPDFFKGFDDNDSDNDKKVSRQTNNNKNGIENVVITGALPLESSTGMLKQLTSDGTTKDYTRFVIPKQSEGSEELDSGIGFASSIQGSGTTTSNTPTLITETTDSVKNIDEIVGINQRTNNNEEKNVVTPYPISFEITHQVAPLASHTSTHNLDDLPLKPEPIQRKPFSPAKPPLHRLIRTNYATDIFVPTRMYISPITEDFVDFMAVSPDHGKHYASPSYNPIEPLHQTLQIDFPELGSSTNNDNINTDIQVRKYEITTKAYSENTSEDSTTHNTNKNTNEISLALTETDSESESESKSNSDNSEKSEETLTDSDYIPVKSYDAIEKDFDVSTGIIPSEPHRTQLSSDKDAENEIASTLDPNLGYINFHQEKDKNEQPEPPRSRLDQFYDNVYMKYEEPHQHMPKNNIISDKNEYEEEENVGRISKSTVQMQIYTEAENLVENLAKSSQVNLRNSNNDEENEDEDFEGNGQRTDKLELGSTNIVPSMEINTELVDLTPNFNSSAQKLEYSGIYSGICSLVKLTPLNFRLARTLQEINIQLQMWTQSPIVRVIDITRGNLTYMENPINMVIVDDYRSRKGVTKNTVMIVAGISGRDHNSVSAAIYFLFQLIDKSEANKALLSKNRFWIIPVLNPDGYQYSTTFKKQRHWVKNLHQYYDDCKTSECNACINRGIHCKLKSCYGVNLDRNFAYQWIPDEVKDAQQVCGNFYAGEKYLSEPESSALASLLIKQPKRLTAFLAIKEGDVLGVMYPYSHTKDKRAFSSSYRQKAFKAASAAYAISGRPYVVGQISEFLPLYSGGLEDWVEQQFSIEDVYTIMLFRPSDVNTTTSMEHIDIEAYVALSSLLERKEKPKPPVPKVQAKHLVESLTTNHKPIHEIIMIISTILLWR